MLLFKKGMLYTKDVRFALPDGFYIQVDGIFYDSGISAWSLDRWEHIIWQTTDSSVGVEEGLMDLFSPDCGLQPLSEVQPIQVNNLSGHQAFAKGYYEARFALEGNRIFRFIVETKEQDIFEAVSAPEITTAFNKIELGDWES